MNRPQIGPNLIHACTTDIMYILNYICNTNHLWFTIHKLLMSVRVSVVDNRSEMFD